MAQIETLEQILSHISEKMLTKREYISALNLQSMISRQQSVTESDCQKAVNSADCLLQYLKDHP